MVAYNDDYEKKKSNAVSSRLAQRDLEIEYLKLKYGQILRIIEYGPQNQIDVDLIERCTIFCKCEIQRHVQEFSDFQNIE